MRNLFNVRLPSFLTLLALASLTGLAGLHALAKNDQTGLAGVIGEFAADADLGCGGRYYPSKPGIVLAGISCGTLVKALNPATNTEVLVEVVGNRPMFRKDTGRIADISVATAYDLGFNPNGTSPQPLVVRVLDGDMAGAKQVLPFIPALANPVPVRATTYTAADVHALTLNMLGECYRGESRCMTASAQVTLNRLQQRWNGKTTLHNVVYDPNQFSWTRPEMAKPPTGGPAYALVRKTLAEPFLNDRLSGDLLAVKYLVTAAANHYYAPDVMPTPTWGRRKGKLITVRMENRKEIAMFHRFYEFREESGIGSLLAKY